MNHLLKAHSRLHLKNALNHHVKSLPKPISTIDYCWYFAMKKWSPYHDIKLYFDTSTSLKESKILDARELCGSVTGHYQARTVHPSMQYFDCNFNFTEPLWIHKILPAGLCMVQIFDGQWQQRVHGESSHHYKTGSLSVLTTAEPIEVFDALPAGSQVRLAGLRIADNYLDIADGALRPLTRLKSNGTNFTQLASCGAISALFKRLYHNPYCGTLGHLHQESLVLALLVELAEHLGGVDTRHTQTTRAQRDLAYEALQLLDKHFRQPPSSRELASRLGIGETTLRRIFRNEFGCSMMEHVRYRRLELGRHMAHEGRWQIAQIAYHLGYSDPSNFTHAYKAHFGHPPGEK